MNNYIQVQSKSETMLLRNGVELYYNLIKANKNITTDLLDQRLKLLRFDINMRY